MWIEGKNFILHNSGAQIVLILDPKDPIRRERSGILGLKNVIRHAIKYINEDMDSCDQEHMACKTFPKISNIVSAANFLVNYNIEAVFTTRQQTLPSFALVNDSAGG